MQKNTYDAMIHERDVKTNAWVCLLHYMHLHLQNLLACHPHIINLQL